MGDPTERPFRFGVNMTDTGTGAEWADKCRAAEKFGYDAIAVPDHLIHPAPFPGLVFAAQATEKVRLGTAVLNTPFYNAVLLARDVATTANLLDGRLEVGLGTGYDQEEFATAGIPWGSPGERIAHLKSVVTAIRAAVAETGAPSPPLLIGARGDRMLRYAAAEADIIGFTGIEKAADGALLVANHEEVTHHVDVAREALGPRVADVEFNLQVAKAVVTDDREAAITQLSTMFGQDPARVAVAPSLLIGTVEEIAQKISNHRKEFGFSYITVKEYDYVEFAPVIELLR